MRPFCLGDQAWIEQEFGNANDLALSLMQGQVEATARLIWHQLTPESQSKIIKLPIKFRQVDEKTGEEYDIYPRGHERFLHILQHASSLNEALKAFSECRGLNEAKIKKTLAEIDEGQSDKKKQTGLSSLI